jgi:hypothetical protein
MDVEALPDDTAGLKAALASALAKAEDAVAQKLVAEAELAVAKAKASDDLALIAHQKLGIAKLERQIYGPRSERSVRLIDQMEFQLEDAEAAASEDELAAEMAVARAVSVAGFVRRRPTERNTFPDHLPRERVVIDPPASCACCGGSRLRKLGEDVTCTLETIHARGKSSRRCARSSPAGIARRSAKRRRRSM